MQDLDRTEGKFREVGFHGCIGEMTCDGWSWKNAIKELQGSGSLYGMDRGHSYVQR